MTAKSEKQLRKNLKRLSRQQLISLALQRTNLSFIEIKRLDTEELVAILAPIPGVLKPVQA